MLNYMVYAELNVFLHSEAVAFNKEKSIKDKVPIKNIVNCSSLQHVFYDL